MGKMRKIMLGLAPALLAMASPALAAEPAWKVSEVTGDVRLTAGGQTRKAVRGALLSTGSVIATGADARAVIVRGEEFVVISPRTQLRLPAAQSPNAVVQLIEDFGTALFKIKKKVTPHFGVQTPYLAAVVKGTTFTVTVGPQGSSVQVTEGAVQVETLDGGAAELVRPGDIAVVGAKDLYQLNIEGENQRAVRSRLAPVAGAVTTQGGPAPVSAAYAGPPGQVVRITRAVNENARSLSEVTDGLLDGPSSADMALAEFREQRRAARKDMAEPPRNDGNRPDDKGPPDDKGKPDDKGPPDDKGKPDDKGPPDDKDKPDDKGPPDDKGKPDDKGPPVDEDKPDHQDGDEPGKDGDDDQDAPDFDDRDEDDRNHDDRPDDGGDDDGADDDRDEDDRDEDGKGDDDDDGSDDDGDDDR